MKSIYHEATGHYCPKYTPDHHSYGRTPSPHDAVHRSDGSVSTDKTVHMESRPNKKANLRNANRSLKKRARQIFKAQIREETKDV
ncbi:MAG: hypothetical protein E6R03_07880 [Hyphomicrobiaceae bacterium]|nr:MAG: hypothetical protein E6R03_07880 [Hyphomicrobiaceae bacterium]